MTQTDIFDMAKQAGFSTNYNDTTLLHGKEIQAFAKLAAAKEREACVADCERHAKVYSDLPKTLVTDIAWAACIDIRDSIKRRGEL